MNTNTQTLILASLLTLPINILAADISHGKTLQQKNCMTCHDDGMYTRDDRKVTTIEGLAKQVKRCELSLGLQWFDEDVTDVTGYLNGSFYQFK